MEFLKAVCLKRPTKNPREKRAGIVATPKINITNAPYSGSAVLAAVIAKKYTKPQGRRPFNIPRKKKEVKEPLERSFLKLC